MKDEMEDSVREYFEFLFDKLDELVIEDISYSDYDQMNEWLGEIKNYVRRIGKKQNPMKPTYDHRYAEMSCSVCGSLVGSWEEQPDYCPECGQAIDWED